MNTTIDFCSETKEHMMGTCIFALMHNIFAAPVSGPGKSRKSINQIRGSGTMEIPSEIWGINHCYEIAELASSPSLD